MVCEKVGAKAKAARTLALEGSPPLNK